MGLGVIDAVEFHGFHTTITLPPLVQASLARSVLPLELFSGFAAVKLFKNARNLRRRKCALFHVSRFKANDQKVYF